MRKAAGGVQGVRKNITVRKPSKAVEVAPGEYVHIPRPAREAFRRPAFAYTTLCPGKCVRDDDAELQRM